MFGSSNPFGQSSGTSPFGSQSLFGQTSNTSSNNPFAPATPFGTSAPFAAQSGSSIFGSTSTGVFGAPQTSSPFASTPTFGASSSPAFGNSTPAFGASPASSPFGGSSGFGQKPLGFSTPQSNPFGNSTQQSQPAFGNTSFGSSTPFGATNTPAFGAPSTPSFGATSTPSFGASSTPAFGATNTPAFGASNSPSFGATNTPAFGASPTPAFGSTGTTFGNTGFGSGGAFGASNTPAFGASGTPAFGASGTPAFGASSTPAFGASSTPAFGASSTPAFGGSSTPSFGASNTSSFSFGSSPAFGQSTSAFGSSAFGSTPSPFGGAQASTPTFGGSGFGQSTFGGQQGGSRAVPYAPTVEADTGTGTQPAGKLESISAMPAYKEKNYEELRWEDYQRGDKGGPLPAGQSPGNAGFGISPSQPNPFSPSPAFGQTSANPTNPFSSSTSTNPFAPQTPTIASSSFGTATSNFGSSPFGVTSSSNLFGSGSSTTTSVFGSSSAFGTTTPSPLFGSSSTPGFGSSSSIFGSAPGQGATPAFGNSQPSTLFNSTPSTGQTGSAFGQTGSAFGQFGQSSAPAFGQNSIFNKPSTGFGNMFSSSSTLTTSSSSPFGQTMPAGVTPFQSAQPGQASNGFGFNNFGQNQAANTTGNAGGLGIFGQGNFGQSPAPLNSVVLQPVAVTNPFGTLPAMPQISINQGGNSPSIQYGISSMPVVDKPAPVRISSLLTSRHLLHRRVRLPARKYRPGENGPKVPFFTDDEESSSTPKADALFIPRENPRALVIRPVQQWSSRDKSILPKEQRPTAPLHDNGKSPDMATDAANHDRNGNGELGATGERIHTSVNANQKPNGTTRSDQASEKERPYKTLSGHRAGEAAIVYEHGADIEALMPKLRQSDYFTEPRIQELAAKERADPGYCRRVRDFVVGRHGYGSIKFMGETDVRRLDLESLVQFNTREVIVYMDESKKPAVGQGLNKPAEVTLLNIKCIDKKTGKQFTEGERVEKYKMMLKKKAEAQGAEFVRWGPWLYYRRVEEGKQYPVLCRRLASLHEEFISHKSPAAGFDYTSGKRIEQKLLDYNQEAERFGGYAYEEMSEISPDHKFLAYTMYDKDNDYFKLCVRNLNSGALCSKPHADRVSNIAWAKNGQALLYVVTDQKKRPCRIYCSTIGSTDEDVLLHEEFEGNVHVNIRHTKDFHFVTVNTFSTTFSKVFLINAADPFSGLALVWEHNAPAHCIIEHHQGFLYLFTNASNDGGTVDHHYLLRSPVHFSSCQRIWETVFINDPELIIEDVDFCKKHLSLIVKEMQSFKICVVDLPLKTKRVPVHLRDIKPRYLPLPKHVSQIFPGTNYDFNSPTMRFTISSLVMPDAVVDYDLLNGKWNIVQQQNMLHERTRVLYGTANSTESPNIPSGTRTVSFDTEDTTAENDNLWNDLTEFYACDYHEVSSHDGAMVPLSIVYSRAQKEENQKPGLLHVHGAYGEMLDKRWRSELKSLLDRGWVLAYADVRGGGGKGKKWHQDGRGAKKLNSIKDYIQCAKYLVENNIVEENKLAGWGYSAGGLVVASAINHCPDLFQAAVLKVPFLDPTHTLIYPILPLTAEDYEEFGYPGDINDFHAIREYSPYDNIPKDVLYPAVLVTSSFNTRFGVWEAAKWVARVRDNTFNDPERPVLLNLTTDIVEENRFLQTKESALEIAFLIKMMES